MQDKIDFVIPWVDGSDLDWINERKKYQVERIEDASVTRYRDWDNLQYWFRGVEKFAPWVHKIHFITWGHIPKWLNKDHPKLNIVTHPEFIPKKYLPVFSANPIELNIHRIKGLKEHFVYFNDDTFIIRPINKKDFFDNGMPNSMCVLCPYICQQDVFSKLIANDIGIINSSFNFKEIRKRDWKKWLSIRNGQRMLMSLLMLPYPAFTGFLNTHLPNAYLKSSFEEVWKSHPQILDKTCLHRFRNPLDVNQHLIKYWQIARGNYNPINEEKLGYYCLIGRDDDKIANIIKSGKYKMICINDTDQKIDFLQEKEYLKELLESILPNKSEYECI